MRAFCEWNKYEADTERYLYSHSREGTAFLVLEGILVVLAGRDRDLDGINVGTDNLQHCKGSLQHSDG